MTKTRSNRFTYDPRLRLGAVTDEVARTWKRSIDVVPAALQSQGSLLVDPRGELHQRFGASIDCLYLIRPDSYVGFRSQPVDADALRSCLAEIFVTL